MASVSFHIANLLEKVSVHFTEYLKIEKSRKKQPRLCNSKYEHRSSSFSAFLRKKGWRRVVSLYNDHDLPLLQPLHWSSFQSIRRCHLSNAGVVDHDLCNLAHILEPFPYPDFRISVSYDHKMPLSVISHGPEILCQLLICPESIHSSCVAFMEFLISFWTPQLPASNRYISLLCYEESSLHSHKLLLTRPMLLAAWLL